MMDPYISHVPFRRQEWKGHAAKRGVRQAIAHDRDRGRLRIFRLFPSESTRDPGTVEYLEAPRDAWDELFADE
ncbi:hypothetical protein [Streptomyces hydrogenans]|uniref:hypothetical protein n=1 Tax=Streptomyces hydrogenans TaxID=1873719 RepID=UPI0035DEDC00